MKKSLFCLTLFAIIALVSCDNQDELPAPNEAINITFNLSIPDVNQTRAVDITRYIAVVYKSSDPTTVVQRVEQASGTIIVLLEPNIGYTCLFWADGVTPHDNIAGTYDATDLKNVTLNSGKEVEEAFFGRLDITNPASTFAINLKRATAQVNIVETDAVQASKDLKIEYEQYPSFNTFTSETIGTKVAVSKIFNSLVTTGTLGSILTLSSTTGIVTDFTATYNSLVTNNVLNVSLKANYITNIRGRYAVSDQTYTLIITVDDNWQSIISGVDINLSSTDTPIWIRVADRNADKDGPHSAAIGASAIDYGYYYRWSNATNDAANMEKAYRACFDFAEGNGLWRLPTLNELVIISGNSGNSHNIDANRKLKWDAINLVWRLYDERPGMSANSVIFQLSGYSFNSGSTADQMGQFGNYWCSAPDFYTPETSAFRFHINNNGNSSIQSEPHTYGFSVRCVRGVDQ